MQDTLHPDRIVVGVTQRARRAAAARGVRDAGRPRGSPFVVTDFPTAELVKTAANSFLATKISFINAMAEVCEAAGGDVVKLAEALGHDDRIGRQVPARRHRLRRRLPAQGHPRVHGARRRAGRRPGADLPARGRLDQHAAPRPHGRAGRARRSAAVFLGKRVAVLGATFKPDSDDVRDSPALNVAGQIHLQGGQVTVYDPKGMDNAEAALPDAAATRTPRSTRCAARTSCCT